MTQVQIQVTPTRIMRSYRTYTSRRDCAYLLASLGPEFQVKARQVLKGSSRARNKMLEGMFLYLAAPTQYDGWVIKAGRYTGGRLPYLNFHSVMSEDRCVP